MRLSILKCHVAFKGLVLKIIQKKSKSVTQAWKNNKNKIKIKMLGENNRTIYTVKKANQEINKKLIFDV
jgi:hypothetical protein